MTPLEPDSEDLLIMTTPDSDDEDLFTNSLVAYQVLIIGTGILYEG